MGQRTSYLRGVRSRLPYAALVGLIALLFWWWLRDLGAAIGLALGAFAVVALLPTPAWPTRGNRP